MIEKTIVLLKIPVFHPECDKASVFIAQSLGIYGFDYRLRDMYLDENELSRIYSNVNEVILNSILAQLAFKALRVFVVTGEDAVSRVFNLKGTKTDPYDCDHSSWRYNLAVNVPGVKDLSRRVRLRKSDGSDLVTIVENFVHAPGPDDVERNLQVFRKYFGQI